MSSVETVRGEEDARTNKVTNTDTNTNASKNSEKEIVILENISKAYNGNKINGNSSEVNISRSGGSSTVLLEHIVLDNLNLRITEGEFVTIVGPSGCGKSTLLNILAGIDISYTGRILVDGAPIEKSPDTDRIIIFQEGALFPWLTVYENIEFGLKIAKISKEKRREIVMHYIDMVQLTSFTHAFVHQLSGGMKQRVAIARALVLDPKILLMDEPFAALDVQTRRMLYDQLVIIHEKTNKTILFVTHNINEAVALGDRAIVISPKIAGIKKELKIDLPRPRQLDHPLINSITNAIIEESKEMYTSNSYFTSRYGNYNTDSDPDLELESPQSQLV
jgi:NitT/TauT family transport system ATP-binding protein